MTNTTDTRRVPRVAASVAPLLSIGVVVLGAYDSYTRSALQPIVAFGLVFLCISGLLFAISRTQGRTAADND